MSKCKHCGRNAIPLSSGLCYSCSSFRLTALKECPKKDLVDELRKRDGVGIFEIEENESFEVQTWDQMNKIKDYGSGQGKAIILRVQTWDQTDKLKDYGHGQGKAKNTKNGGR